MSSICKESTLEKLEKRSKLNDKNSSANKFTFKIRNNKKSVINKCTNCNFYLCSESVTKNHDEKERENTKKEHEENS